MSVAAADEWPPPGQLVGEAGRRIHVLDEGAGPPVLLMAALGSNWFDLDHLTARLVGRGRRVIRYDRPGYGLSDPPERHRVPTLEDEVARMDAVLDRLGVTEPVTLVGHSLASLYVEAFARLRPARTAGVVVLDGSYVLAPWRIVPPGFRVANAHRVVRATRLATGHYPLNRHGGFHMRRMMLPVPPEGYDSRQQYWSSRLFGGSSMVLATFVENAAFPTMNRSLRYLRQHAPMPSVPVVVVAAMSGPRMWRTFWLWKQRRYARVLGARLLTVSARHFVVLEIPDEVADIVDGMGDAGPGDAAH
ncbi:alpha/beta fold hydrolase [Gordonia sp. NPDC003429]